MIRAVNWDPRVIVPIGTAEKLLESLEFAFTAALGAANAFLPQAAWVRIAPATPAATVAAPTLSPVQTVHGTTSISGEVVVWRITDPLAAVATALQNGGLILVDLDCDYIVDGAGALVSGSASLLAGAKPPVRPGGIFHTWIQVAAG
jgi:hypothetical protein